MKSIQGGKSLFLRTATIAHSAGRSGFESRRERAMDVVTFFALVAMVVALYVAMFVALYRWSVYAPVFQPDSGTTTEEALPWPD
jgi:hypothetical protein